MGIGAISGITGGAIAVIAGILVLIWPRIIAWVLGIFLIIFGANAIMAVLYW